MKITDVLHKQAVIVDLEARDKKGVLEELAAPVADIAGIDRHQLVRVLMDRERIGSTGIGKGIGIPHGKIRELDKLVLGFGLSRRGVEFDSMDKRLAHIFFLLVTPESSTGDHLKLLARLSRILNDDDFRRKLMTLTDADQLFRELENVDGDL